MAQPVVTVLLGSSDISLDVASPPGEVTVKWGRGGNFDGTADAPGYAVLIVRNNDKRFNPRNGSSPYTANLRLNKLVRITAVHSATTYYLFHGFLRRIVQRDDGYAEIHAQDALFRFSRREASVALSITRSISAFRGLILDDIGETSGNRSLALGSGPEAAIPLTAADQRNVLSLLTELNANTGTLHYINPDAAAYDYTTLDRLHFEGVASSETWTDADISTPFAESLAFFDYTDEGIINSQRVYATLYAMALETSVVWTAPDLPFTVPPSTTVTVWASFSDIVFNQALAYTATNTPTVTPTPFARSAKITITAGGSASVVSALQISGNLAAEQDRQSVLREDATSITTYERLRGQDVAGEYIPSVPWAEGMADYKIWRYKDPRANPPLTFVNRFPTQLARDVADVITLTSSELSLSAARMIIRAVETTISDSGARWATAYQLEEMPAVLDLFTVGGTAGQGVGGTGILGY